MIWPPSALSGNQQLERVLMKIPINSILIPRRFVTLCEDWHDGVRCTLYAISTTGDLTIGTHPPRGCDTAEQAYLSLWRDLAYDASCMVHTSDETLAEFEVWVDEQVDRLEESYGLADWERSFR